MTKKPTEKIIRLNWMQKYHKTVQISKNLIKLRFSKVQQFRLYKLKQKHKNHSYLLRQRSLSLRMGISKPLIRKLAH